MSLTDESVLMHQPPLQSVTTDRGEGGHTYFVGDPLKPGQKDSIRMTRCQHINVTIEPGPSGAFPAALCVLYDNTVKMVNLATALEWEIADKLPEESAIIQLPGIVSPNQPN